MKLIRQPVGSSCCGQACVAMVLGVMLDESIALHRTRGATNWPDLRRAMVRYSNILEYDLPLPDRLSRVRYSLLELPKRAILVVHYKDYSHWVVKDGNKILDPAGHIKHLAELRLSAGWFPRVTSYAEIK